jgi:hypothetical protein
MTLSVDRWHILGDQRWHNSGAPCRYTSGENTWHNLGDQTRYIITRLMTEPEPIFDPDTPEPVVHHLAVPPGESDSEEFVLRAVRSGKATLNAGASFEVHLGYPGPAYWGYSGSGPLTVIVAP